MSAQEYWFARRQKSDRRFGRRGVTPINAQGWASLATFIGCMLFGGLLFAFFMSQDRVLAGIVLYVMFVVIGAGQFIYFVSTKTDPDRHVGDYRAARQGARLNDQLGGRR
jgi:hypothetical protein